VTPAEPPPAESLSPKTEVNPEVELSSATSKGTPAETENIKLSQNNELHSKVTEIRNKLNESGLELPKVVKAKVY